MKTPILVSKIRANTTGLVKVELFHDCSRPPLYTFLFPVTDAARDEYNPNSTRYQYDYRITSKLNKFIKDHNLRAPADYMLTIHDQHIIPVDEIPAYKTI